MGLTAAEKILAAASDEDAVEAGDIVEVDVDLSWVHETQLPIFRDLFEQFGGEVWDREKAMFMVDHIPNPNTVEQAEKVRAVHEYAAEKGMEVVSVGIKHQAWRSLGRARPGAIMVGPDSHTPTAGALGAFAACLGPTDTAVVWNRGRTWLEVPETLEFELVGEIQPGVTPRDIGFVLLERFGGDTSYFANGKVVEFSGPFIETLGLDGRQTLCNVAVEMGATATYIEPDEILEEAYLEDHGQGLDDYHRTDDDATAIARHTIDVSGVTPKVAFPHSPSNVRSIDEAAGIEIERCFIGSCANGMLEDIKLAADYLEGRSVADDVELLVTPATDDIRRAAAERGYLETLTQAGARVSPNYCSACVGYEGVLAAGERCLSTNTRNYRGRMGHRDSEIYLGSPAVVAASSTTGRVKDPREVGK